MKGRPFSPREPEILQMKAHTGLPVQTLHIGPVPEVFFDQGQRRIGDWQMFNR
jgi:hypothetical protein